MLPNSMRSQSTLDLIGKELQSKATSSSCRITSLQLSRSMRPPFSLSSKICWPSRRSCRGRLHHRWRDSAGMRAVSQRQQVTCPSGFPELCRTHQTGCGHQSCWSFHRLRRTNSR